MHHHLIRSAVFIAALLSLFLGRESFAQTGPPPNYPRVTVYLSVAEPVGSLNRSGFTDNFSKGSTITFPAGINLLKSDQFGISFELAPAIRIEKGVAKTSSINFHPGTMFRFKHGFTLITRAAFESNGRFGFTPVYNQIIRHGNFCNYFIAASNPVRFGNNAPASIGLNLQVGVAF